MGRHSAADELRSTSTGSNAAATANTAQEDEGREAGAAHFSPLDAAAARGPMHWADDPELDPPGTPEPLHVAHHDENRPSFIGIQLGAAGPS